MSFIGKHKYFVALVFVIFVFFILTFPLIFNKSTWYDEALYSWYGEKISKNPADVFSYEVNERHPLCFLF